MQGNLRTIPTNLFIMSQNLQAAIDKFLHELILHPIVLSGANDREGKAEEDALQFSERAATEYNMDKKEVLERMVSALLAKLIDGNSIPIVIEKTIEVLAASLKSGVKLSQEKSLIYYLTVNFNLANSCKFYSVLCSIKSDDAIEILMILLEDLSVRSFHLATIKNPVPRNFARATFHEQHLALIRQLYQGKVYHPKLNGLLWQALGDVSRLREEKAKAAWRALRQLPLLTPPKIINEGITPKESLDAVIGMFLGNGSYPLPLKQNQTLYSSNRDTLLLEGSQMFMIQIFQNLSSWLIYHPYIIKIIDKMFCLGTFISPKDFLPFYCKFSQKHLENELSYLMFRAFYDEKYPIIKNYFLFFISYFFMKEEVSKQYLQEFMKFLLDFKRAKMIRQRKQSNLQRILITTNHEFGFQQEEIIDEYEEIVVEDVYILPPCSIHAILTNTTSANYYSKYDLPDLPKSLINSYLLSKQKQYPYNILVANIQFEVFSKITFQYYFQTLATLSPYPVTIKRLLDSYFSIVRYEKQQMLYTFLSSLLPGSPESDEVFSYLINKYRQALLNSSDERQAQIASDALHFFGFMKNILSEEQTIQLFKELFPVDIFLSSSSITENERNTCLTQIFHYCTIMPSKSHFPLLNWLKENYQMKARTAEERKAIKIAQFLITTEDSKIFQTLINEEDRLKLIVAEILWSYVLVEVEVSPSLKRDDVMKVVNLPLLSLQDKLYYYEFLIQRYREVIVPTLLLNNFSRGMWQITLVFFSKELFQSGLIFNSLYFDGKSSSGLPKPMHLIHARREGRAEVIKELKELSKFVSWLIEKKEIEIITIIMTMLFRLGHYLSFLVIFAEVVKARSSSMLEPISVSLDTFIQVDLFSFFYSSRDESKDAVATEQDKGFVFWLSRIELIYDLLMINPPQSRGNEELKPFDLIDEIRNLFLLHQSSCTSGDTSPSALQRNLSSSAIAVWDLLKQEFKNFRERFYERWFDLLFENLDKFVSSTDALLYNIEKSCDLLNILISSGHYSIPYERFRQLFVLLCPSGNLIHSEITIIEFLLSLVILTANDEKSGVNQEKVTEEAVILSQILVNRHENTAHGLKENERAKKKKRHDISEEKFELEAWEERISLIFALSDFNPSLLTYIENMIEQTTDASRYEFLITNFLHTLARQKNKGVTRFTNAIREKKIFTFITSERFLLSDILMKLSNSTNFYANKRYRAIMANNSPFEQSNYKLYLSDITDGHSMYLLPDSYRQSRLYPAMNMLWKTVAQELSGYRLTCSSTLMGAMRATNSVALMRVNSRVPINIELINEIKAALEINAFAQPTAGGIIRLDGPQPGGGGIRLDGRYLTTVLSETLPVYVHSDYYPSPKVNFTFEITFSFLVNCSSFLLTSDDVRESIFNFLLSSPNSEWSSIKPLSLTTLPEELNTVFTNNSHLQLLFDILSFVDFAREILLLTQKRIRKQIWLYRGFPTPVHQLLSSFLIRWISRIFESHYFLLFMMNENDMMRKEEENKGNRLLYGEIRVIVIQFLQKFITCFYPVSEARGDEAWQTSYRACISAIIQQQVSLLFTHFSSLPSSSPNEGWLMSELMMWLDCSSVNRTTFYNPNFLKDIEKELITAIKSNLVAKSDQTNGSDDKEDEKDKDKDQQKGGMINPIKSIMSWTKRKKHKDNKEEKSSHSLSYDSLSKAENNFQNFHASSTSSSDVLSPSSIELDYHSLKDHYLFTLLQHYCFPLLRSRGVNDTVEQDWMMIATSVMNDILQFIITSPYYIFNYIMKEEYLNYIIKYYHFTSDLLSQGTITVLRELLYNEGYLSSLSSQATTKGKGDSDLGVYQLLQVKTNKEMEEEREAKTPPPPPSNATSANDPTEVFLARLKTLPTSPQRDQVNETIKMLSIDSANFFLLLVKSVEG